MWHEFKAFLTKSNALALAVGVIVGAATGKVVTALVEDLLMPVVGLVLPKGDWREAQIVLSQSVDATGKATVSAIKYGHLIGSLIDFIAIAAVVFVITRALIRPDPETPTQTCLYCKETNAVDATKCKACGSRISAATAEVPA
jgi:large conductance mechanosensitive channel